MTLSELDPRNFVRRESPAEAWASYSWITWAIAVALGLTAGAGFTSYAVVLYILSALACCFCPCLGYIGAATTTAIWGMLWIASVAILVIGWTLASLFAFVGLLRLFTDENSSRPMVIGNFLFHALLGVAFAASGWLAIVLRAFS